MIDSMRYPFYIFGIFICLLVACSSAKKGLVSETITLSDSVHAPDVVFIDRPALDGQAVDIRQDNTAPGRTFEIVYPDSAILYYVADNRFDTPNSPWLEAIQAASGQDVHIDVMSGDLERELMSEGPILMFINLLEGDVHIVFFGRQADGRLWKEMLRGQNRFGYANVEAEHVKTFDRALRSLRHNDNSALAVER